MSYPPTFARASELYDVRRDERIPWDWTNDRPLAESQSEIEAALPAEGQ